MKRYFLAVDIGASSGRHVLGWIEDGVLQLQEVYRFPNGVKQYITSTGYTGDLRVVTVKPAN